MTYAIILPKCVEACINNESKFVPNPGYALAYEKIKKGYFIMIVTAEPYNKYLIQIIKKIQKLNPTLNIKLVRSGWMNDQFINNQITSELQILTK